jgi:hypothetical protein
MQECLGLRNKTRIASVLLRMQNEQKKHPFRAARNKAKAHIPYSVLIPVFARMENATLYKTRGSETVVHEWTIAMRNIYLDFNSARAARAPPRPVAPRAFFRYIKTTTLRQKLSRVIRQTTAIARGARTQRIALRLAEFVARVAERNKAREIMSRVFGQLRKRSDASLAERERTEALAIRARMKEVYKTAARQSRLRQTSKAIDDELVQQVSSIARPEKLTELLHFQNFELQRLLAEANLQDLRRRLEFFLITNIQRDAFLKSWMLDGGWIPIDVFCMAEAFPSLQPVLFFFVPDLERTKCRAVVLDAACRSQFIQIQVFEKTTLKANLRGFISY